MIADLLHGGDPTLLRTLGHALLIAIPLLIADVHRTRHANLELLQQRSAERERLRIARDLHDVIAHTLTTINVQAATAAQLIDRDPAHARSALETIEDASRDAIAELRAVLGVLRSDHDAPLAPAPGLDQLGDLVARARADGVPVELDIDGERPDRLPDGVSLAAFRIVQESLTNARRHAAGAAVRIALAFDRAGLYRGGRERHGDDATRQRRAAGRRHHGDARAREHRRRGRWMRDPSRAASESLARLPCARS